MKLYLVKRENASEVILTMMIWAIVAILGTRLWLEITGYPVIGRGEWHIAHVMWGGLLMMLSTLINFAFHGNRLRKICAGAFGFGFGLFIDETGKFLSRDNNYFFQPAIILIYLLFIVLFFVYRYLEKTEPKDPKSLLFQVISGLEEVAEGDLDNQEKEKMLNKLTKIIASAQTSNLALAKSLKTLVEKCETNPKEVDRWGKMWRMLRRFAYRKIFKRQMDLTILMLAAIYFIVGGIIDSWYLMSRFEDNRLFDFWYQDLTLLTRGDLIIFSLKAISDGLASVLFVAGTWWVVKGRKRKGVRYFQYGLLVNIFLASVFKFYFEQFSGVFGLGLSIIIYYGLDRLRREVV